MKRTGVLREGFSGLGRAKLAAAGSVMTIVVALLLLGFFYVVSTNMSRNVRSIREKVEMEAFLSEPVTRVKADSIGRQIAAVQGVDSVQFVSKEDEAKLFRQEFGEDISKVLDFNPLPPSFKIFLKDDYRTPGRADEIHGVLSRIPGIDNAIYRKEMLEFIEKQSKTLYTVGLTLGILISISAIFLVFNTIRLAIYSKRDRVHTMTVVGESWWRVRAPFLIEGIIQGLVGGMIAAGIMYYALTYAAGFVSPELMEFTLVDNMFYALVVIAGVFLGLLGSAISVGNFIREKPAPQTL